jgi:hypothetical protein
VSGRGECAREAIGAPCESLALYGKKMNSHQRIGVFRLAEMLSDRCKIHDFDRAPNVCIICPKHQFRWDN